jgi:hypothetical protein
VAEVRARLVRAIRGLGEKERLATTFYYFEGLTLREIGQVLELRPRAASRRYCMPRSTGSGTASTRKEWSTSGQLAIARSIDALVLRSLVGRDR